MNTTSSLRQRVLLILATTAALALPAAHAQSPAQSSAQSAAPAAATSAPVAAPARATPAAAARLNIRDIYDRASAAGYRDLYEIELDHGRYKVKGYDAQGARVKVYFNATTGAVEDGRKHR
ncbi:PepSY domain-containing protein [Melaminivora sp.]|uniref:PepSY domain-containing protein n=1 Tax=Melaminivora sp. TaxID=1933032 RepID=UPI0028AA3343|nr:PepSY domain-containing protein [Melaminivora sp.]